MSYTSTNHTTNNDRTDTRTTIDGNETSETTAATTTTMGTTSASTGGIGLDGVTRKMTSDERTAGSSETDAREGQARTTEGHHPRERRGVERTIVQAGLTTVPSSASLAHLLHSRIAERRHTMAAR